MPAAAPPASAAERRSLAHLGERIRAARKQQGVSAVAAAQAAGISRVTLHRIERGEATVAMSAWVAAAAALGLEFALLEPNAVAGGSKLPEKIRLRDYPQLKKLAWQVHAVDEIAPREALDLYERNWRHVDRARLTPEEAALVDALTRAFGGGRLLV